MYHHCLPNIMYSTLCEMQDINMKGLEMSWYIYHIDLIFR